MLSEQQVAALLPPSLRYALAVAAHRYPRYFLRALNSFDELYALLMLLVERYFLRTFGGSFTENFYGLKRERVLKIRQETDTRLAGFDFPGLIDRAEQQFAKANHYRLELIPTALSKQQ